MIVSGLPTYYNIIAWGLETYYTSTTSFTLICINLTHQCVSVGVGEAWWQRGLSLVPKGQATYYIFLSSCYYYLYVLMLIYVYTYTGARGCIACAHRPIAQWAVSYQWRAANKDTAEWPSYFLKMGGGLIMIHWEREIQWTSEREWVWGGGGTFQFLFLTSLTVMNNQVWCLSTSGSRTFSFKWFLNPSCTSADSWGIWLERLHGVWDEIRVITGISCV